MFRAFRANLEWVWPAAPERTQVAGPGMPRFERKKRDFFKADGTLKENLGNSLFTREQNRK